MRAQGRPDTTGTGAARHARGCQTRTASWVVPCCAAPAPTQARSIQPLWNLGSCNWRGGRQRRQQSPDPGMRAVVQDAVAAPFAAAAAGHWLMWHQLCRLLPLPKSIHGPAARQHLVKITKASDAIQSGVGAVFRSCKELHMLIV